MQAGKLSSSTSHQGASGRADGLNPHHASSAARPNAALQWPGGGESQQCRNADRDSWVWQFCTFCHVCRIAIGAVCNVVDWDQQADFFVSEALQERSRLVDADRAG